MTADETDFPDDISELARRHGRAAILVLAEIMTQEDAPAGARVTAAKALLERGWGKSGKPPDDGNRLRPVTKIVRRIIDPKQHGTIDKSRATHSAERPSARAETHLPLRVRKHAQRGRWPRRAPECSDGVIVEAGGGH